MRGHEGRRAVLKLIHAVTLHASGERNHAAAAACMHTRACARRVGSGGATAREAAAGLQPQSEQQGGLGQAWLVCKMMQIAGVHAGCACCC